MASTGAGQWDPDMRASDADRERLVEQLREHHAAGRLTLDEFEERMRQAYDSKTYGELRVLTRDLPVDLAGLTPPGSVAAPGWGPGAPRRFKPIEVQRDASGFRVHVDHDAIGQMRQAHLEARMHRHGHMDHQAMRDMRQAQRDAWMARRGRNGGVQFWVALSVLLTGIWLISNIAGAGNWTHFWPIWPIGISGLFMLMRRIRG